MRFKQWNGDFKKEALSMAELIYKGPKDTQNKSDKDAKTLHLQYCGHEIMSKRIYEATKAEID